MILHPILHSSKVVTKYHKNPILSSSCIPYPSSLVYNAGITKYEGKYIMIFRNDYYINGKFQGISLGIAYSDDGIRWEVAKKPFLSSEQYVDHEINRIYDPRLTVIDGRVHICFAMDTQHGIRGGIAITEDFESMNIISLTAPDNRNMVLFPQRINDKYVRLERPFPVYGRGNVDDRFDIWLSKSPDLKYWGDTSLVLGVEHVSYANDKIGPGAPPVKTDKGWLTTFHAVDKDDTRGKNGWEDKWTKRYCAGIMLLDLDNPEKVIGISKEPLIAPELDYETEEGCRTNVIFPGGMILEDDGEVKIYYGAADAVECLATADVNDLLELCRPFDLKKKWW